MSWYQSALPREYIVRLHCCEELPMQEWDEQWFAEDLLCNCARYGVDLWIAGKRIPVVGGMFENFICLEEISGQALLNPQNCKNLSRLFAGCRSLRNLNVSHWNTAAATTAEGLFDGCSKLEKLDVSHWKLGKCRNLSAMFRGCEKLQELDVSQWNVGKVRDFSDVFFRCMQLKKLDVSRWNTAAARRMDGMFLRCKMLQDLDVSAWNVWQVEDFSRQFYHCESLKKVNLNAWKMQKDAIVQDMFLGMYGKVTRPRQLRFRSMKAGSSWLKDSLRSDEINKVAIIEFRKNSDAPSWFYKSWAVDAADSGFLQAYYQGEKVIVCSRGGAIFANENSCRMFCFLDRDYHSWIRYIDGIRLLDTRYTTDFSGMFSFNLTLTTLDIAHFDMSKAENCACMFEDCQRLRKFDMSGWKIPPTCRTEHMFHGCDSWESKGLRIIK